jgi:hypothetical protein
MTSDGIRTEIGNLVLNHDDEARPHSPLVRRAGG